MHRKRVHTIVFWHAGREWTAEAAPVAEAKGPVRSARHWPPVYWQLVRPPGVTYRGPLFHEPYDHDEVTAACRRVLNAIPGA